MHPVRSIASVGILAAALLLPSFATQAAAQEAATPAAATPAFDPARFAASLETVAEGLDRPVFVADPGDDSGRLFVVEQSGTIRIMHEGEVDPEPFLDISGLIATGNSEQGLLGLAFDPSYEENGEFYVAYTANQGEGSGDNTLARYRVAADDPDRADPDSAEVLLAIPDPFPNHNGGMLAFGPDGHLYVATGDGGAGGDPLGNGQNPDALLGKILRLEVSNRAEGDPYAIPEDNPFVDGGGAPEVWAWGLRNPWRFSFDRETGDLWIADVGQNWIEEVSMLPAGEPGGANLGWNVLEGTACFADDECDPSPFVAPVAEYTHEQGCSVTGGYVYRGEAFPTLRGTYLFADYCTGLLWGLGLDANGEWALSEPIETGRNISSFSEDAAGGLYLIDLNGTVFRVVGEAGA
jgi:glucose/arabinose dehydrogenase